AECRRSGVIAGSRDASAAKRITSPQHCAARCYRGGPYRHNRYWDCGLVGVAQRSPTAVPVQTPAAASAQRPPAPEAEPAPRLSIVVLPFGNLSNDPEQEYFAGITDDLTTDLSRFPGSLVIARNTAFTYKGKPTDVKQIGRDLGVRYVVEGSVRRA